MTTLIDAAKVLLGLGLAVVLGGCGGGGGGGGSDSGDPFTFRSDASDRYARLDRMGEPALATAFLSSRIDNPGPVDQNGNPVNPGTNNRYNKANTQRDAENRGDPINDARDFTFMLTMGPQVNSLANFHYKLGPQLRSIGITLCSTETASPPSGISQIDLSGCMAQVGPVIIPDVITYDANAVAGWPNGRGFDDPVVDRLIALSLLKISGPGAPHNIDTLVGVLSPSRDDTGTLSPATFPYLRAAHPPP